MKQMKNKELNDLTLEDCMTLHEENGAEFLLEDGKCTDAVGV